MEFKNDSIEIMGQQVEQILMIDENGSIWIIPEDQGNSDYQEYLKWKAEQKGA